MGLPIEGDTCSFGTSIHSLVCRCCPGILHPAPCRAVVCAQWVACATRAPSNLHPLVAIALSLNWRPHVRLGSLPTHWCRAFPSRTKLLECRQLHAFLPTCCRHAAPVPSIMGLAIEGDASGCGTDRGESSFTKSYRQSMDSKFFGLTVPVRGVCGLI